MFFSREPQELIRFFLFEKNPNMMHPTLHIRKGEHSCVYYYNYVCFLGHLGTKTRTFYQYISWSPLQMLFLSSFINKNKEKKVGVMFCTGMNQSSPYLQKYPQSNHPTFGLNQRKSSHPTRLNQRKSSHPTRLNWRRSFHPTGINWRRGYFFLSSPLLGEYISRNDYMHIRMVHFYENLHI